MLGGLLKSASAVALVAAAGLYGASPARAADLGGDCCADLEERVAELEATTVRKGNRKVSLTISGHVGHAVMWWNDGTQSDAYINDPSNLASRWRFVGSAKITPQITAGFLYEFQVTSNASGALNQLNNGDDLGPTGSSGTAAGACGLFGGNGCTTLRDQTVWLRHAHLGMVKIGHGSTATDNLVLIDVGGQGVSGTPDIALHNGGFILRGNNGLLSGLGATAGITWAPAIRGHEAWDTNRRNHVLYETPSLAGFTLQAAVAEDNYWDVALRYAGEFGGFRIAGGIGYQEDTEFNASAQLFNQAGALCSGINSNCNVKYSEVKGALSIMHVPTGLFVTGSAGTRDLAGNNGVGNYTGPDARYWRVAAGISQNFFGIGRTVLFGEYGEHRGFLAQEAFRAAATAGHHCTSINGVIVGGAAYTVAGGEGRPGCDSEVTQWGVAAVQYIDAAAMEIFATYKNYSLDSNGFLGGSVTLNSNQAGVHDFQLFMVGTKINF